MYLPKSKYSVSTAKPGEYTLDGKSYVGPVITTCFGESYAGSDLNNLKGQLVSYKNPENSVNIPAPVVVLRIPTEEEYTNGYMIRYFKQNLSTMKVVEILPDAWKKREVASNLAYASTIWFLKGTLDDTVIGGYTHIGIRKKNQEAMDGIEKLLPGIISSGVLNNPEQFVRP